MGIGQRIRRVFTDRHAPVILMFHRIAQPVCDPWGLAVAPALFAEQMQLLRERWIALSLPELVNRLHQGTLPRRAVAVTFDDGYVDNLEVAKPILERAGVPATVFLATGYVDKRSEFWWDELARMILAGRAGAEGSMVIAGQA